MTGAAVALVLTADEPAVRGAAKHLFPAAEHVLLPRQDLRLAAPFAGRLFTILCAQRKGGCVGLVVPVVWRGDAGAGDAPCGGSAAPARPAPVALPASTLLAVSDHVNLELRGPLTGRWPAGVPRAFPPLTGIYQPADVRALGGARVYSSGVVVAGVADAGRLTPFEAGALREAGLFVVSDSLVPAAIVAAFYGLTLAACGVPRADDHHEE
ncbi:MAG: hypothetical protein NTX16_09480 [Actinobacteria bacterium]|nr:hypothetical protein [Actinomycetota bacterium]